MGVAQGVHDTAGTVMEGRSITLRSTDRGRTWEAPVDVEPSDGPESSYAVMLKAPGGRIFVFYNHNTDNLRRVKADSPPYADGWCRRVDSLGHFVFKYSDDHGKSWNKQRYEIPQRNFEIDRNNAYAGAVKFFWNVGAAFTHGGAGYVPIIKVGGFGEGGSRKRDLNLPFNHDIERPSFLALLKNGFTCGEIDLFGCIEQFLDFLMREVVEQANFSDELPRDLVSHDAYPAKLLV